MRPDPARRRIETSDHRIDPIAIALRIIEPLQDEGDGRVGSLQQSPRTHGSGRLGLKFPACRDRTRIGREVDRSDDRRVEVTETEPFGGDRHRLDARSLVGGDGEAGPADPEFASDPAGDKSAQ